VPSRNEAVRTAERTIQEAERALREAEDDSAVTKKKLNRLEASLEDEISRKMAKVEPQIKDDLSEEISRMKADSEAALKETLRDLEKEFEDDLEKKIAEVKEEIASKLKEEKTRIQELHDSTVSKVQADFQSKADEKLDKARKEVEEELAPTEDRKAFEDATARIKAEEQRLEQAQAKLENLTGKKVERRERVSKPRDAAGDFAAGEKGAVPNGKREEYSYSYTDDEAAGGAR